MWQVGVFGNDRYPWHVYRRRVDGTTENLYRSDGAHIRRFATAATAQRAADRKNSQDYGSHAVRSARRHVDAAIKLLTRATADAQPNDARLALISQLFDVWQELDAGAGDCPSGRPLCDAPDCLPTR